MEEIDRFELFTAVSGILVCVVVFFLWPTCLLSAFFGGVLGLLNVRPYRLVAEGLLLGTKRSAAAFLFVVKIASLFALLYYFARIGTEVLLSALAGIFSFLPGTLLLLLIKFPGRLDSASG